MSERIVIVACGKTKAASFRPALTLYKGPLYMKRATYAMRVLGGIDYILSAKHHLLEPSALVYPYDKTLTKMLKREREAWGKRVEAQLMERTAPGDEIVILAGEAYLTGWREALERAGRTVTHPFAGLTVGRTLRAINDALAKEVTT